MWLLSGVVGLCLMMGEPPPRIPVGVTICPPPLMVAWPGETGGCPARNGFAVGEKRVSCVDKASNM